MKPEDFLTPEGKLKAYRKPAPIEYDTRLSIACTTDAKERFKAACEYMHMSPDDQLHILLTDYIEDVVEFAGENFQQENEILFWDARKHLACETSL
ncbi:MAG: hypothetical protein ABW116_14955 [Candidatus Sedimenticola sp. 20ELBAFRAG]